MRDFKEKLFPLSAVFLAFLVLGFMIRILFVKPAEVLTGPPDLYVTIDGEPFFLQESSSEWHAILGAVRSNGEGHGHEATEKDEISTSADAAAFDFGEYTPKSISATYAESLTAEEMPAHFENGKLRLEDGLWIYTVKAEWEGEKYNGKATYSLRINKTK